QEARHAKCDDIRTDHVSHLQRTCAAGLGQPQLPGRWTGVPGGPIRNHARRQSERPLRTLLLLSRQKLDEEVITAGLFGSWVATFPPPNDFREYSGVVPWPTSGA